MYRIIVLFALVCGASPMAAQKVRVDLDRACDFSRFQTYRWADPPDVQFVNQLMQQRVIGFVEEALAARRLRRVETGGDLLVGFHMEVREQDQFTTFTSAMGFGWDGDWGSAISTTVADPIFLGTLIVDVVDARTNRLVFEGVSTATISSKPEKNTKELAKGVNKIFEKYPLR